MDTFLEGVDVIDQPCTFAVLIPGLAIVLAARRNQVVVVVGYVLGVALLMWSRAAIHWTVEAEGIAAVIIAAVILGAFISAWRPEVLRRLTTDRPGIAWGSGLLIGAVSGWLWQPCVGLRLGDIFNNADSEGARTLGLMVVYVAGAVLPALLFAIAPIAVPAIERVLRRPGVGSIGAAVGVVYAGAVLIGWYDDLVSWLLQHSTA